MKVLVVRQRLAERIRERLPEEIEIVTPSVGDDEELVSLAADVEVILATRLSPEVASAAGNLRLLQKTGAGVDDMPFDALGPDVWVANTSGANPVPLAEGAIALVMALAKRVVQRHMGFREGRSGPRGVELRGKRTGIIGIGSIGMEVARRLKAFEMDILAVRRHPDPELKESLGLEFLGGRGDLDRVMRESDFVVVTVPLTPETSGMIGEREIRLMKPTAFIVNVARAAIIQEEPLYRALEEGRIAGAALDVWWKPHWWDPVWNPEGMDASKFPFWELSNVICIPHNIGSTDSQSDAALEIMVENILRTRDGRPPINQVDKRLRY
jgi:phosphoglycerate dehydrogenase-like enzyme